MDNPDSTPAADKQRMAWQTKLLPFVVIFLPLLCVVYFWIYVNQIGKIEGRRQREEAQSITQQINALTRKNSSIEEKLYTAELLALLHRHQSADDVIDSRMLTISLSFLTGVILAFVGAIFILGKFSEDPTKLEASQEKLRLSLVSSSPGIILSTLGVALICICIVSKTSIDVKDEALYLNGEFHFPTKPDSVQKAPGSDSLMNALLKKLKDITK